MPQEWKLERTGHIQSKTEHNIDNITQTPEGTVYIQMGHTPSQLGNIPRTFSTRSERSYISHLIEDKDYIPYPVSTSQESERDEQNHHEELIKSYMEELKKELVKSLLPEDKTDVSMTGSSNEDCLVGELQDPDMEDFSQEDIDHMVQNMEDAVRKDLK
ncbi:hypothetical protein M9H77_21706 [Catharanthus roseus]|uniref:Uncharacterized protein n=1 Tax=Catharanthus roseus TaxID=4058 RepID=A0ACC0AN37_CATRO|nr:hypothetical protein M9H77_21706 [Catharanthus roseus]